MSEEARAQLASKAKLARLMVRTATTGILPNTPGSTGQFNFVYKGSGIFYPKAVFSFGVDWFSGEVVPPYPAKYSVDVNNQYGDRLISPAGMVAMGDFNSYYDNFDHGVGLAPQEYYIFKWQLISSVTLSIWVCLVGEEYLF